MNDERNSVLQQSEPSRSFKVVDVLLLVLTFAPVLVTIILKILFVPAGEGISISGAAVFGDPIPMPIQNFPISEAQINSWMVIVAVLGLCLYLTHGIRAGVKTKRQYLCEWAVEKLDSMTVENMGEFFKGFAPFIASILVISAFSSLLSLFGVFAPTSDINIIAGWAILVFILITYYKLKGGVGNYAKGFLEPIPVMLPLNILGEVATPVSMAFRHFGNVLSGSVIAVLIAAALQGVSGLALSWLPEVVSDIPIFRVGIPAVLSLYFDIFSGVMQAYIFAMLTMMNISGGFPQDLYEARLQKKLARSKK